MKRPRSYQQLPSMPATGIFNPNRGFFSVITPVARTNLITNPSAEIDTTGWSTTGSGAFSRPSGLSVFGPSASYHGVYSLSITTGTSTGGCFYATPTLTSGTVYVASAKFLGMPGVKYKLSIATTGAVDLPAYRFIAAGRWQWIWVMYKETSSTTRRIYFVADNDTRATLNPIYIDGLQLEACGSEGVFVSTYIDGDQQGLLPNQNPPPYGWNGTPHASTSYRLATTRAGGRVVNLDSYRYKVLAYFGLGLTALTNIATPPAPADGAGYQTTIAESRQFSVNGFFDAPTFSELQRARSRLYSVLGPDSISPRQPSVLVYQAQDPNGAPNADAPVGQTGRIIASYDHGLEGASSSPVQDSAPLSFTQWLPTVLGGDSGVELNVQTSVTNANNVLQRSVAGLWSAMGTGSSTGASRYVRAIVIAPDGSVYAGGDFDTMGGVASTSKIAKWNPVTGAWSALSTGITGGSVFALAVGPDGTLYAGGNFTTSGGTATANISKWNGSAWSTVGVSGDIGAAVNALAVDRTGVLYVGGDFSNAGGVAAADFIAKWNGTAWTALGAALNQNVTALVFDRAGNLYLGGLFTDAGGVADADRIAMWNGSAYSALGTGANNSVYALAIGLDGLLYAGGNFTTLSGAAIPYIGRWNGGGWLSLGSGVNNTVRVITANPLTGVIFAGGDFTTAGGITLPDQMARWNGSAWVAMDVDAPGVGAIGVGAIAITPAGVTYVGYNATGTATAAGVTLATNDGTARAYPSVVITGPSSGSTTIYQMLNATTGKLLYMNLSINAGETITLTTSPQGARLSSTFRGDVSSSILPGSSPDIALEKGANSISFFSAGSTVTAIMQWTIGYQSVDDLTE